MTRWTAFACGTALSALLLTGCPAALVGNIALSSSGDTLVARVAACDGPLSGVAVYWDGDKSADGNDSSQEMVSADLR